MKNVLALAFIAFTSWQCAQNPEVKESGIIESTSEIEITNEELRPYALTVIDSVYSVRVHLKSEDTALVVYHVQLYQGEQMYIDSLVVSIPAGEVVQGELIFSACRVKNRPEPTFTSKISRIDN